jgi:hypothetical protein
VGEDVPVRQRRARREVRRLKETIVNTEARTDSHADSQLSVLASGLVMVLFGLMAVLMAIDLGWVGAATLGAVLLLLAWKVPTSDAARALTIMMAGLGIVALLGAVFDLLA